MFFPICVEQIAAKTKISNELHKIYVVSLFHKLTPIPNIPLKKLIISFVVPHSNITQPNTIKSKLYK